MLRKLKTACWFQQALTEPFSSWRIANCTSHSSQNNGAVKLMKTRIWMLPQPKSMHSIIDATQREQRHGLAWNWCVGRGARTNKTPHPAPVAPLVLGATPSLFMYQVQAKPYRCSRRVASIIECIDLSCASNLMRVCVGLTALYFMLIFPNCKINIRKSNNNC